METCVINVLNIFYVSGSSVIVSMRAFGAAYSTGMLRVRGARREGGLASRPTSSGKEGGQGHIWHISGAIPVWFKMHSSS